MSRPAVIQLNIPAPCSQNWENMTTSEQGRFCEHCGKCVIDFTTWSYTAVFNFFSKNNMPVCGRMFPSQLNRTINIPYQPHSKLYRFTIALGLALLFSHAPAAYAQTHPPKVEQASILHPGKHKENLTGTLKGKIVDENKEPLLAATIRLYQNDLLKGESITDIAGQYDIGPLEAGKYEVRILYAGYESITRHVVIKADRTTNMDATLTRREHIFTGEIINIIPQKAH